MFKRQRQCSFLFGKLEADQHKSLWVTMTGHCPPSLSTWRHHTSLNLRSLLPTFCENWSQGRSGNKAKVRILYSHSPRSKTNLSYICTRWGLGTRLNCHHFKINNCILSSSLQGLVMHWFMGTSCRLLSLDFIWWRLLPSWKAACYKRQKYSK